MPASTRFLLTAVFSASLFFSTTAFAESPPVNPHPPAPEPELIEFTGVVKHIDLEGGFWGIVREDGNSILPFGLPKDFEREGLVIKGFGEVLEVATIQQWGIPVQIIQVETIEEPKPETEHLTGIVIAKGENWIEVIPDGSREAIRLTPRWRDNGHDKDIVDQIAHLYTPNRVAVTFIKGDIQELELLQPEHNEGVTEGIVVDKGDDWIDIEDPNGTLNRYRPQWTGGLPSDG
ncbi:uncharacterized protein METZ01_LOCUS346948, partial [marine metagenome]